RRIVELHLAAALQTAALPSDGDVLEFRGQSRQPLLDVQGGRVRGQQLDDDGASAGDLIEHLGEATLDGQVSPLQDADVAADLGKVGQDVGAEEDGLPQALELAQQLA